MASSFVKSFPDIAPLDDEPISRPRQTTFQTVNMNAGSFCLTKLQNI